jgi:Ca2+-binding EF-hand superfamily protein
MGDKDGFSEPEFEETFNFFDADKSGLISKDEMCGFIKKIAGI